METVFLDVVYYIYILLFGAYVSIKIACGKIEKKEWQVFCFTCPLLLLLQGVGLQFLGLTTVRMLYPLITHLPILLVLIVTLKVHWERSLLSVIISYSLCQLTRWIGLVLDSFMLSGAAELILTTGGTGFSQRDVMPEATEDIIERRVPGIPEAMRAESMRITPKGCLSRSAAGIRKRTLIINLPGSKKASMENILAVIDPVEHGLQMLMSEGSADCAK